MGEGWGEGTRAQIIHCRHTMPRLALTPTLSQRERE
jgi:hypothetical protein